MSATAPRPLRRGRPRAGFTLIELMVTLTLLGALMALSVPSFVGWIRNAKVRTVSEALQTGIRTAQNEAVRRNRQVVLFFTNDAPSKNVVVSTHPATDAVPAVGGTRWALQTAPGPWGSTEYITGGTLTDVASGIAVSNVQGATAICFNANGRLATTAADSTGSGVVGTTGVNAACTGQITTFNVAMSGTAKSDDHALRVIVQLGGQIRMCDPGRPTLSAATPDGCPAS